MDKISGDGAVLTCCFLPIKPALELCGVDLLDAGALQFDHLLAHLEACSLLSRVQFGLRKIRSFFTYRATSLRIGSRTFESSCGTSSAAISPLRLFPWS